MRKKNKQYRLYIQEAGVLERVTPNSKCYNETIDDADLVVEGFRVYGNHYFKTAQYVLIRFVSNNNSRIIKVYD